LKNIEKWLDNFEDNTAEADSKNFKKYLIEVILVGNKSDIADETTKTKIKGEAEEFVKKNNILGYFETSSKD
jgi:hypothetical protein